MQQLQLQQQQYNIQQLQIQVQLQQLETDRPQLKAAEGQVLLRQCQLEAAITTHLQKEASMSAQQQSVSLALQEVQKIKDVWRSRMLALKKGEAALQLQQQLLCKDREVSQLQ